MNPTMPRDENADPSVVVMNPRMDKWKWFLIEVGIRTFHESGYVVARQFLLKYKIKNIIIDRVLKYPEQRRTPIVWSGLKLRSLTGQIEE